MAKVLIQAGAEIDVPTRGELQQDIGEAVRSHFTEQERVKARGVKFIRVSGPGPAPAAGTLYIPNGPAIGYIWALRMLSVQTDAADTVLAWITSSTPGTGSTPQRLITNLSTSSTSQVALFATAQAMLYGGESVYVKAAAHNITSFFLSAWEVPSEMEYKLL